MPISFYHNIWYHRIRTTQYFAFPAKGRKEATMNEKTANIDIKLEEVHALICAVATATGNKGEATLTPEAVALALDGIAARLRTIIDNLRED